MSVELIGNYPHIPFVRSGLFSLDVALGRKGQFGIPLRTIMELYGPPNSGKSTLAYHLAPALTVKEEIVVCDFELADREYIKKMAEVGGLTGRVRLIDSTDQKSKKPRTDEERLQEFALRMSDDVVGAGIVDAVGSIRSTAEAEGEFGEANMGKRAKLVGQVARALGTRLRNKERPSIVIFINHVHSIIGGRGHLTAGGETLKYEAAMRVMLYPKEVLLDSDDNPLGFLVQGRVEKLRYAARGRSFTFYIVPEFGVHVGASAMFDCFEFGLAERGTTVKLDGKSMGYINKEFLQYAVSGRQRKFTPFVEALQKYEEKLMKEAQDEPTDISESTSVPEDAVHTGRKSSGRKSKG